jgi:hypothetical protein
VNGTLETFGCWSGLLQAVKDGAILYYHAPLDVSPRRVSIVRAFKNGKLRILAGDAVFTADPGHLDRFRWFAMKETTDAAV